MDWKEIGCYVGIKFDGTACNISTGDGKVKIVSEDGMDYTKNLPTMVKELSKFPEMVFPAELELWIGGKHAPRATSAGVLNAKRAVENEKHIRANVYDMLYFEGKDLHNLPYSERLKYMAKLKDTKHVVKTSRTLCTTEAQVRKAIEKYSSSRSSEGAMLKLANFKYELDKKTKYVLKFKKELQLRAQVIKINKVKGTTGTYSYVCALTGPEGLHYIGKTFNTKIKADIGDTINVSFVDVYAYEDKETGKKWANWYAPHVISKDTKNPDSISKAWKMAEETTGVKETKKEPKVKDFSSKKKRWVAQFHIRGGSVHIDFRTEENGYLRGFTLAPAVSEKFLKEIETHWELKKEKGVRSLYWDGELAYQFDTKGNVTKKASLSMRSKIYRWHVTFMKNPDLWKMDMKTGEELKRKTKTGETAQKIYALRKKIEPLEWLTVKGVTAPREVEDVPGGTALFPGVFVEIDSGTYDMGTRKVYYHEYFLKGSKWKGRFIFRQVAGLKDTKKHLTWLYWKADTTLPYVLSRRAVRESWFPKGYSALPEDLENKVPSDLNYWKTGLTGKQRTERRNELILKLKETLKKREMSALELDFIKPLKPYKGEDYTNEFFSVKDLKGFDCSNKIIGPKVDGLRMQIMKQGNSVKCYSAYGNQFALHKLGSIPDEIRKIDAHSFILDGELYLAGKGHNEVHEAVTTDGSSDLRFMAFDILHANGIDLEKKSLLERKKYLNCIKSSSHISKEPIARFNSDKELVKLVEKLRSNFEGAMIKDLRADYFKPKSQWKMVFIEKQFKELDALDQNSLGDMKIVCSRLERKVQEGRSIPISFEKLSRISAMVGRLHDGATLSGEFILSRRYWKGATIVRGQEVSDFHIKFPGRRFHLDGNPADKDVTATCFKNESGQNEYFIAGEYEPGTEINPNKKIKANIEILDKGSIKVIETGPKVTKVKFSGTKLKGIHTFKRTTPLGTIWSMIKGDSSKGSMSRNISFQFKDFMVKVGQKTNKLIDDIKFPYIKEAVAFSEGTWHNRFYPWDEIRKSAPLLVGKPIGTPGTKFEVDSINDGSVMVLEHSDGILENVGNVRKSWIDNENKCVRIEFEIIDTTVGKDCALLIENEKIPAVSVRIEEDDPVFVDGVEVSTGIHDYGHVALTDHPEVTDAIIKN